MELLGNSEGNEIKCLKAGPARADPLGPLGPLLPGKWRLLLGDIREEFIGLGYFPSGKIGKENGLMWGPVLDVPEGETIFVGPFNYKPSQSSITIIGKWANGGRVNPRKGWAGGYRFFAKLEAMTGSPGRKEKFGVLLSVFPRGLSPIWMGIPPGRYLLSFGIFRSDVLTGVVGSARIFQFCGKEQLFIGRRKERRVVSAFFSDSSIKGHKIKIILSREKADKKKKVFVKADICGENLKDRFFCGYFGKSLGGGNFLIEGVPSGRYVVGVYKKGSGKALLKKEIAVSEAEEEVYVRF